MSAPINSDWFNTMLEWAASILFILLAGSVAGGVIGMVVLVIVGLS